MVIPWLMGFPVEMRLGAVGAPEEHRKVKRGREASRNRCVTWRFLWFGKRKPKMTNHLEINSIWKNLGINSIWKNYIISWVTFYMLKCILSGKKYWKRTIMMIHRQHQSSQSNWNAKSKWNHDDRTDHKKRFPDMMLLDTKKGVNITLEVSLRTYSRKNTCSFVSQCNG